MSEKRVIELIAADIGGTNARFAFASVAPDGVVSLDEPVTLPTSDFVSLQTAWEEFARRYGKPVPPAAAIAIAASVRGQVVRMTNNSWTIDTARLDEQLGLERVTVLNDFAAITHAAARLGEEQFEHLCGPEIPLPQSGTVSVLGPGTGLGVGFFHRSAHDYHVQGTEGGHMDFAPLDGVEDAILARLRARHRRVSVERVVAGPAICDIYETLAALEKRSVSQLDHIAIWERGTSREDVLAAMAIERFCMSFGSVAGDVALVHGAVGVVIAGGVGQRIRKILRTSGFAERFRFKGRHEQIMAAIPVKILTHPQPGLYGAAAAFAKECQRT